MTDPCCVHYDGPPAHSHSVCCIEDGWQGGRGCELVTDEQRQHHDAWFIALTGGELIHAAIF